ncbi:MAG: hypothetical protein FWF22_01485 [Treponema sp.]|nr:hypothetical protein [Treponema sp.]
MVGDRRTVLIVTDGSKKVAIMAESIAGALQGKKVQIREASVFNGTDLLAADIILIGCQKATPDSFDYLDELLQHVNLAGRSCGIFSPASKKAVQYLAGMLRSSEALLKAEPLLAENSGEIHEWAARVAS